MQLRKILNASFLITLLIGVEVMADSNTDEGLEEATFAGGCFWCMQPPYDNLKGVKKTYVGYTGGKIENPSYEAVSEGTTGHTEAVLVVYDPKKISYKELLKTFWKNIDPTQADGQFADRGSQYRTAIFFHNEEQKKLAEESKRELEQSGKYKKDIVTSIEPVSTFYRAELYHQDYYKKNKVHYNLYKMGSGRAAYIKEMWGGEE